MSTAQQQPKAIVRHEARGLRQADACEDGQTLWYCPVWDGPRLAPMHPLHGPRGALLATLPQWPRIKPFTCSQYRQAGHRCTFPRRLNWLSHRHRHPAAFESVPKIVPRHSHLGSDCSRVTTALRCVVTRPLAHGSRHDMQLPVTSTAFEKLGRPLCGPRLLHCNNATRSRSEKLFPRRRREPPVPSGESTGS